MTQPLTSVKSCRKVNSASFLPTPFKNEQTNTSDTFDLLTHQQLELQQLSIHNFLSLQILQTNQLH